MPLDARSEPTFASARVTARDDLRRSLTLVERTPPSRAVGQSSAPAFT